MKHKNYPQSRWQSTAETKKWGMNRWAGVAGVAVGALAAATVVVNLPDILRYRRIHRM
jgi:hypothetical protein